MRLNGVEHSLCPSRVPLDQVGARIRLDRLHPAPVTAINNVNVFALHITTCLFSSPSSASSPKTLRACYDYNSSIPGDGFTETPYRTSSRPWVILFRNFCLGILGLPRQSFSSSIQTSKAISTLSRQQWVLSTGFIPQMRKGKRAKGQKHWRWKSILMTPRISLDPTEKSPGKPHSLSGAVTGTLAKHTNTPCSRGLYYWTHAHSPPRQAQLHANWPAGILELRSSLKLNSPGGIVSHISALHLHLSPDRFTRQIPNESRRVLSLPNGFGEVMAQSWIAKYHQATLL